MATVDPTELYCGLMEEIKLRLGFIDHIRNSPGLVPQITKECCTLQLRMIHELIAIACIVIHSKHVNIGRLEKQWSANEIVPRLEKLNPEFFPKAIRLKRAPAPQPLKVTVLDPQPMTKTMFLKTYGRCGDQLHRGTLKKITKSLPAKAVSFDDILEITATIKKLLERHAIHTTGHTQYYCDMYVEPTKKVMLFTAEVWTPPR